MKYFFCIFVFLAGFCMRLSAQENSAVGQHVLCTEQYISDIYMTDPKRALDLLDEAEVVKTMPLYLIDDLRSMVYRHLYQCKSSFRYARRSYVHDSIANDNLEHLLKMTITLAELSHLLSHYKESNRYAIQGIQLARKIRDKQAESKLLLCMGENKRILSFKEDGYHCFEQAIDLLDGSQEVEEVTMLSYFYGVIMGYLITDNKLEKALDIGLKRERMLDKVKSSKDFSKMYLDEQYAYVYSKLAYLCYMTGKRSLAADYFEKYQSTHASTTPDGKYDATPYYLVTGRYQEVLDNCRELKEVMRRQDTLNYQYVGILQKEIKAYKALNDFKRIAELRESVIAVINAMNARDKQNAALELDALYEASEREARIAKQAFQLRVRNVSLFFIVCLTVSVLFFLWRLIRQNRIIKDKNRMLVMRINERLSMQKEIEYSYSQAGLSDGFQLVDDIDIVIGDVEGEHEINKIIFQKLDHYIRQNKLYLSADLSREDLARKVRMNNTRFAKMIKENTGINLNGYINNLRLDHAIELLKEHPEYTLRAIAEASGINSMPTFHSLFKCRTGMTPSEFKSAQ